MQNRKYYLCCGKFFAVILHVVDWNAAAVVDYGDGVVDVDRDVYAISIASQSFVNRIVDNFVDEMMQPHLSRRSDVHRRAKPNSL